MPRKPFSSKQKKEQLQAKRERKRNRQDSDDQSTSDSNQPNAQGTANESSEVNRTALAAKNMSLRLINQQPTTSQHGNDRYNPNRFNLHFLRDSPEELKQLKRNASKPLAYKREEELEMDIEDVYKPSSPLDMPIRPNWSYEMTKEQLEEHERKYFSSYLNTIFENFKGNELSYFEMNLETWRQLWRVVEISDIILLIVDIRFPALHFSPVFYDYCRNKLQKDVIVIFNKIDLVDSAVVIAWKSYFKTKFPDIHIVLFSSAKQINFRAARKRRQATKPAADQEALNTEELEVKALSANIYTARAHRQLYECVKSIVQDKVDLSSWANLTEELVKKSTTTPLGNLNQLNLTHHETNEMEELINSRVERKKFTNNYITIGCCGFPNVGKSSLLNSLNGRKVVSVSRTPGHTKHLQTIFLTKSVRLCDCPGLVFPSLVNKQLQILAGIYPIAQLQEPYSSIRYLAERIPLIEILKLKHTADTGNPGEFDKQEHDWSPLDICEAWAIKRGYYTAKASRPDVYRAANELLRMALDGRICLSLRPRNYHKEKTKWQDHSENKRLNEIAATVESMARENRSFYNFHQDEEECADLEDEDDHDEGKNTLNDTDDTDDDEFYARRPRNLDQESNEEKETAAESEYENKYGSQKRSDESADDRGKVTSTRNPYALLQEDNSN